MDAEGEIRRRIAEQGLITFAEFMEVALYWPVGGFYSTRHSISPHDNFYTAASAHPAFGALLSLQLFQFWQLLEAAASLLGGGDGRLRRHAGQGHPGLQRPPARCFPRLPEIPVPGPLPSTGAARRCTAHHRRWGPAEGRRRLLPVQRAGGCLPVAPGCTMAHGQLTRGYM